MGINSGRVTLYLALGSNAIELGLPVKRFQEVHSWQQHCHAGKLPCHAFWSISAVLTSPHRGVS